MEKTWRMLKALAVLSLAACGSGTDEDGSTVCTGTYSGAVTGKVKFCSLEAAKLSNGQLQYTLSIEPEAGSGTISDSGVVLIYLQGDPKTGTFSGTSITQALGTLESTDGKQYAVQLGTGTTLGSVTLTIDSVPAGQNLSGGSTLYQWFGGKAQLQYAASGSGATGTVDVTLNFEPQ